MSEGQMQTCPKCHYVRLPTDTAPGWQCPNCGIAYAKFGSAPLHRPTGPNPGNHLGIAANAGEGKGDTQSTGIFIPDIWHLLAAGSFLLGIVLAYQMWKSGERGLEIFFYFPVFMALGIEATALVGALYLKYLRPNFYANHVAIMRAVKAQRALEKSTDNTNSTTLGDISRDSRLQVELGPEVFRCRALTPIRFQVAESNWLSILIGFADYAVRGLFGAAATVGFAAIFGISWQGTDTARTLFIVFSLVGIAWYIWLVFFANRDDHLIIYQGGVRIRCNGQSCNAMFREIKQIEFGHVFTPASSDQPRELHPGRGLSTGMNFAQIMNVFLSSGRTIVLKGFLLRFKPEDLEKFFDYLEHHHSELLRERAHLVNSPEGDFFRITRRPTDT